MYRPNVQSVALPIPGIIAIAVLGWGCEPPVLGKKEAVEVGDSTVRKRVHEFLHGLHSNFSSIFSRFRFCAPARHFFAPHLCSPQIVPRSPGSRWMAFELGRAKANCG